MLCECFNFTTSCRNLRGVLSAYTSGNVNLLQSPDVVLTFDDDGSLKKHGLYFCLSIMKHFVCF